MIFLRHLQIEFRNFKLHVSRYSPVESRKKISAKLNLPKKIQKFLKTAVLEKLVFGVGAGSSPKYFLISAKMGQVSPYQVPFKQK